MVSRDNLGSRCRGEPQWLEKCPCILLSSCMLPIVHVPLSPIVLSLLILVAMPPHTSVKSDGQLITVPPDGGPTSGTQPAGPDSEGMPVRVIAKVKTDQESYSDACLGASLKNWLTRNRWFRIFRRAKVRPGPRDTLGKNPLVFDWVCEC